MISEDKVPIEQRYLCLEGKASHRALELVKQGLPENRSNNSEVLFVSFAYADLPIGKEFHIAFPKGDPELGIACISTIAAVTQQLGKPFDCVPHGWKTICVIEFPQGIPDLINELPTVDGWYISERQVCVCAEETWNELKKQK